MAENSSGRRRRSSSAARGQDLVDRLSDLAASPLEQRSADEIRRVTRQVPVELQTGLRCLGRPRLVVLPGAPERGA